MNHTLGLAALGAAAVVAVMTLLWLLGIRQRNMSYVDVGWSANFALLALVYGFFGHGDPSRRVLAATMFALWSIRLAAHLARRIVGEPEEGRYQELRRKWGGAGAARLNAHFYGFFLLQGALNVFLSLPLLVACENATAGISALEWLAFGVWVIGLAGEALADRQLRDFKREVRKPGQVCERGLWHYSRHPNYFFEWTVWVAYALLALASPPLGYFGPLMPALMLYFLLKVTGIPATEEQALRSKGEAYRDYQRRTSAFVPWWPRASEKGLT